jgi:hypothetical protein
MPLPPRLPFNNSTYFEFLKNKVNPDFNKIKLNENPFELNFDGLSELLEMYSNIDYENVEECVNFSRSFNVWSVYVSMIKAITKKFWLDSTTLRIEKVAIASKNADEKSVANGDRCANKDPLVVEARNSENSFESFFLALDELEAFLIRCHYEIKLFCELNLSSSKYGTSAILVTNSQNPPLPPSKPFTWSNLGYLEYLVMIVKSTYKEYGMDLNFAGITALIKEYIVLEYTNLNNASRMSREFNMWSSYIDTLESTTKKLYLDADTKKTSQISIASFLHGGKNKAHGERLANMDKEVIKARQDRNSFDAFHGCLESLEEFLIRCHYETRFFTEVYNPKKDGR